MVGCWFGDGATSEGDWHEGLNFAGIHRLPVRLRLREQPATPSACRSPSRWRSTDVADRAEGYGFAGRGRRRQRRARRATRRSKRARGPGPRRRGPDADRVQDLPLPPAHLRRRRPDLPLPRGGRGGQGERPDRAVRGVPDGARPRSTTRRSRRLAAEVEGARSTPTIDGGLERRPTPSPATRVAPRLRARPGTPASGTMTEKNVVTAIRDTPARRDGRPTTASWCWARTSAPGAACSGPPRASSTSSASGRVIDTPLAESGIVGDRDRDGAARAAARSPRSSSPTSSTRRSTRSCQRGGADPLPVERRLRRARS